MYRYLVFDCDEYYPAGGMADCILKTNDLEEAKEKERIATGDWTYIYDVATDEVVGNCN